MGALITGIRVDSLDISREKDSTEIKCSGNYALISDKGVVMAKQGFNGYNDIKVQVDPAAMRDMLGIVEEAIAQTIGIKEKEDGD
jgi:hypothetical protein